jgi:hypothetical protein
MFEIVDIKSLIKLFTLRTKKELEAHAGDVVVHSADFASFIMACDAGAMPWDHLICVNEFVPKHLILNERDRASFDDVTPGPHTKGTQKATNKIFQLFEERRHLVGHIFYNADLSDWHFVYFDQRDQEEDDNHWTHGPHIHFVNVLWPRLDPQKLWENFCTKSELPGGALHIRYKQRPVP